MEKYTKGDRVATHPATDVWMQGDRYGTILAAFRLRSGEWAYRVRLDSGREVKCHERNLNGVIS